MDNIEIFIDAEYVIQSLRSIQNKPNNGHIAKENFNWVKFIEFIAKGRTVNKLFYYTARMSESENIDTYNKQTEYLQSIEETLAKYNIQMRLGKMIKTRIKHQSTWKEDGMRKGKIYSWVQKGIDSKIIWDLCSFAFTADKQKNNVAIVVTGDEDFAEILKNIQELQINTELVTISRKDSRISKDLEDSVSSALQLDFLQLNRVNVL